MGRIAILAVLVLMLAGRTQPGEAMPRVADNTQAAGKAADESADQRAAREMDIGRYYLDRHNYVSALNRFKVVVIHFPTPQYAEELLARLAETYLALGIASEAQ